MCFAGQFLTVHGNFLLQIRGDNFPILPRTECSLIQKFGIQMPKIMYFASFQQNNSEFKQNDHGFKKYLLRKKFVFLQLVTKIAYFAYIRPNNSIFMQKKKNTHFETKPVTRNHKFY